MEDLDVLYSPSRWSKRLGAEEVITQHVSFVSEASRRAKENVACELGVAYGNGANTKLDIFGIDLPKDSPIFIYIHGGYWQELSREISSYVVEPLCRNNFKVIVIGYDLCPAVTLPDIIAEIQLAFNYCINYAKLNGSRSIYMAGHSAGAHLTTQLFAKNPPPDILKSVFLISGVYDLSPLIETYVNNPLKLDKETAKALSPQHQNIFKGSAKFYVIVGEHDSPAFKAQSEEFFKKLGSDNAEFLLVKEKDHFDIVECLNQDEYELVKLIINSENK